MNAVVDVQVATDQAGLPAPAQITRWVETALAGQVDTAELVIRIVGEAEGRELNERWRGGSGATNVLSFPAGDAGKVIPGLLGDIVICAPLVAREAAEQGKPEPAHWAHLVIHGVLHLLGYDHVDEGDAGVMEALEVEKLAGLGIPDPYVQESL